MNKPQDHESIVSYLDIEPYDVQEAYDNRVKQLISEAHGVLSELNVPHVLATQTKVTIEDHQCRGTSEYAINCLHPLRDPGLYLVYEILTAKSLMEIGYRLTSQMLRMDPNILYLSLIHI